MDKKEIGKKVWNKTKEAASIGVGFGTGIVTTTICMAFAPQGATRAFDLAFKAGTYGLSGVMGTVAADLTKQEIDAAEEKTKLYILRHRNQNKVKVEVVK